MAQTAKNMIDSALLWATRFNLTDDSRLDQDAILYKLYQLRAEEIIKEYAGHENIDPNWLSDLGVISFHKVNRADDPSVICNFDIFKANTLLPQTVPLKSSEGNLDLGFYSVMSVCGKTMYYPSTMASWRYCPPEHVFNKFGWYTRINQAFYVDKIPGASSLKLRIIGILANPEEGKLINSAPIASGSIVNGTSYTVRFSQIIYMGATYQPGATFTGGATATFAGNGTVYLTTQVQAYRDIDPFPAGADMINRIEFRLLTEWFGIEKQMITDIRNDSKDDSVKVPAV